MKINKLSLFSGILGVFCASNVWAAPAGSLTICNAATCTEAKEIVTDKALYHRLSELFAKNAGRKMTFCDADPAIHLCYQQSLKMTVSSDLLRADIGIDSADILEVKPSQDVMSLSVLLDVSVDANGTYPACESSLARINVGAADKVSATFSGFGCSFTSSAKTMMNLGFAIDYIDFENATIGGYYVMDVSGNMQGKRTAYALMRFAEPVSGVFDMAAVPEAEVTSPEPAPKHVSQKNEECPPCIAEQVRDDEIVRSAIAAAAKAEAEAKAAAERAVKMAEEAAQTTTDYALKKAQEAEKAKQEAEKAAEMALAARGRVDNKVAAMSCQGDKKKQTTMITTTVKRYDENGNEIKPTFTETVSETWDGVTNTIGNAWDKVSDPVVEAWNPNEPFADKWNRWMDKAEKVFWLEEPLF